jgi:hypothetical protein
MHLGPELKREPGNDELGIAWDRDPLGITEELHARVLTAGSKHGIGNVVLLIGVGEAKLLGRSHWKVRQPWR